MFIYIKGINQFYRQCLGFWHIYKIILVKQKRQIFITLKDIYTTLFTENILHKGSKGC